MYTDIQQTHIYKCVSAIYMFFELTYNAKNVWTQKFGLLLMWVVLFLPGSTFLLKFPDRSVEVSAVVCLPFIELSRLHSVKHSHYIEE